MKFLNELEPYLCKPESLVFLDESGFHKGMTRGYSRAHRQKRAYSLVSRNKGKNHTLICTMTLSGVRAPLVMDGSVNGVNFEWYIKECLCPTLKAGDVVVMDNLSSHHRASEWTLCERAGGKLLYLSAYSPDFNPIELLFSKVKALVRAGNWQTIPEVIQAIFTALDAISLEDIRNWFKHAHPTISL